MLNVLIADDHAIVRKGLRDLLFEMDNDCYVVEAANGTEALSLVPLRDWDIIILDISMPGMDGLTLLRHIKEKRPSLPILMLSMHGNEAYVRKSLRAGASGYLTKESAASELVAAIRAVQAGHVYIGEGLRAFLDKDTGPGALG